jgi:hypothetical protein
MPFISKEIPEPVVIWLENAAPLTWESIRMGQFTVAVGE